MLVAMADVGAPTPTAIAPPVWLKAVTVEGFRGIGPAATLELEPAPGLTVVVGRNGSGKSSFAEGLELLMTGVLKRWEKRPKAWTETWQCLHHDEPTRITARAAARGRRGGLARADVAARRGVRRRERAGGAGEGARAARVGPRPAVVPAVSGLRRAGDDVRHAELAL